MIDYRILKLFGTTNERLREICTSDANPPGYQKVSEQQVKDRQQLEKWKKRFSNRLHEGVMWSLRNYKLYGAVDLAWDSTPISKDVYPLMLYAQGKIDMVRLMSDVTTTTTTGETTVPATVKPYLKMQDDKIVGIDLPKFVESSFNLVRSIVSRRVAAQTVKYNQLWPYYKYESRNTGLAGKLKADVLSQSVDVIADQFGYRQHDPQVVRDMFLYSRSVDFVKSAWEVEYQYRLKNLDPSLVGTEITPDKVEKYVVKEGLSWVNPHPTRLFYDAAYPLTTLNTDTGIGYIGFWDVKRFSDIHGNKDYWNRDKVSYGGGLWDAYHTYGTYFNQYLHAIVPPIGTKGQIYPANVPGENDRQGTLSLYTQDMGQTSSFVAEYYERLIPCDEGIGTYDQPVWVRFVLAGENTILFAQIMPSTPAAVCTHNENEGRRLNLSLAHEILQYQDILTNLTTAVRSMLEAECAKIFLVNIDVLKGPGETDGSKTDERLKTLRSKLSGKNWASDPTVVEYSMSIMEELKMNPKDVLTIVEPRLGQSIETIFRAIQQFIAMVERLNGISPAEQGQPAPRETSATETAQIATTTQAIENFISDGIDEYRAAKKRIIYESLVACSQRRVRMPVIGRYTEKTVKEAGFAVDESENEDFSDPRVKRRTVTGDVQALVYDYNFTSRDGADRPVNSQAAAALVQSLSQIMAVPQAFMALGKEKLYSILNEIFRLSGAGFDLNLELKEGEDDSLGQNDVDVLKQTVEQIVQALNQTAQEIAKQQSVNETQEQQLVHLNDLARVVQKMASDVDRLMGRVDQMSQKAV